MAADSLRDYISVSQLEMVQRCGIQFQFRYEKGMRLAPGIAAIRGSGFHHANRRNFEQKVTTYVDLPTDEVVASAAEYVDGAFGAGEVYLTPDERTVGLGKLRSETKDAATQMVGHFMEKVAPHIQPEHVEKKVTFNPDADKFPTKLMGILDLVKKVGASRTIVDMKTGARSPNADAAETSQQLTMYSLLYRALTGEEETAVELSHVIRTSAGRLSSMTQTSHRDIEDIKILVRRLAAAHQTIKAGIFLPTNPSNWWCDEKWCGFWNICPFVRQGRRT